MVQLRPSSQKAPPGSWLTGLRTGQLGLLIPAAFLAYQYFLRDYISGLTSPVTADQVMAERAAFRSCFESAYGAGHCAGSVVAFLLIYGLGSAIYGGMQKGSIFANWSNVVLAAASVVLLIGAGANLGLSTFGMFMVAGFLVWLLLGVVGLVEQYKYKNISTN